MVTPRNTIPIKTTSYCYTSVDNQIVAGIKVYEGERMRASDNNLLGSFCLSRIPTAPHGHPLCVSFSIEENDILAVCAEEESKASRMKP